MQGENTFTYFFQCPICWNRTLVAAKKMQRGCELGCVWVCVCPLWLYKALLWVVKSATQMTQELNKCWVIRLFVISTFFPSPLPPVNTRWKVVGISHHTKTDRWTSSVSRHGILRRIQYPLCASLQPRMHNIHNQTITIRGTFCYSGAEGRGKDCGLQKC